MRRIACWKPTMQKNTYDTSIIQYLDLFFFQLSCLYSTFYLLFTSTVKILWPDIFWWRNTSLNSSLLRRVHTAVWCTVYGVSFRMYTHRVMNSVLSKLCWWTYVNTYIRCSFDIRSERQTLKTRHAICLPASLL